MAKVIQKAIALLTLVSFFISPLSFPVYAQTTAVLNLPLPGTMIETTSAYHPMMLRGLSIYPDNPLQFDFIVDSGDALLTDEELQKESEKLVKYFLASLTIQEDEMWVNLSPYEKDRIIPSSFGQTEMGRDLLAQDYILKQLTASLMNPNADVGNNFWKRVYERAQEKYGTTNVPMDTFNKVWIVPDQADVYINPKAVNGKNNVFVVNAHLKVFLEEDYLALESNAGSTRHGLGNVQKDDLKKVNESASQVIREIILPEIEREVNEGKTFANLRQIYNAMILAAWYKQNLKKSLLGEIYVDQAKTKGVDVSDPDVNQKIYNQYLKAFETGAYDLIKEDYDPIAQEIVSRKYFSGGIEGVHRVKQDQSIMSDPQRRTSFLKSFSKAMVIGVTLAQLGLGPVQANELPSSASAVADIQQEYAYRQETDLRSVYRDLIQVIRDALTQPGNEKTTKVLQEALNDINVKLNRQERLSLAEIADLLEDASKDDPRMNRVNSALEETAGIYFLKPFNKQQPTLLFIHGANEDPFDNWRKAFARFENDYNIAFVIYNHFDDFESLSLRMSDQIASTKKLLGLSRIGIIAHSIGSYVVREMYDRNPQVFLNDVVVTTGEPAGGFWQARYFAHNFLKKIFGIFVRKDRVNFADLFNPFGDVMTRLYNARFDADFRAGLSYLPIQTAEDEYAMPRGDEVFFFYEKMILFENKDRIEEVVEQAARGRAGGVTLSPAGLIESYHSDLPNADDTLDIIEDQMKILRYQETDKKDDSAITSQADPVGGIDFNPANLKLNTEGQTIEMRIPENLKSLQRSSIEGFLPVIHQITPITNLPLLIGKLDESSSLVSSD
jgi:pimeloyl-ACP methyl ester carboxylesterase